MTEDHDTHWHEPDDFVMDRVTAVLTVVGGFALVAFAALVTYLAGWWK